MKYDEEMFQRTKEAAAAGAEVAKWCYAEITSLRARLSEKPSDEEIVRLRAVLAEAERNSVNEITRLRSEINRLSKFKRVFSELIDEIQRPAPDLYETASDKLQLCAAAKFFVESNANDPRLGGPRWMCSLPRGHIGPHNYNHWVTQEQHAEAQR